MAVSDFRQLKNVDIDDRKFKVTGFSCTVIGVCPCTPDRPLMMQFIPGVDLRTVCKTCGMQYELQGFQTDKSGEARVSIKGEMPLIAPPGALAT